ncbi:NAD(P)H-quinone oxidoreductase subunit S, chloroplastic-like [Actinidia eriantha]|uniref:NAD(P)H-quinone oxidoreductase subunit S, chloroplastic-like n=1 Tax=Actinidia eriantha TaxID=165200 RepID=UPI00258A0FBE|nr:NAD(P)H-quinone oxidoreductase subunit S, chloroplastic-like [Actinidia eriantha]
MPSASAKVSAKFNLYEIMGGRGLYNGEAGLNQELKKTINQEQQPPLSDQEKSLVSMVEIIPEDGFGKELLGLTGGFLGGEKGLKIFIEKNPPSKRPTPQELDTIRLSQGPTKKLKPPELPLLMPRMITIVKNPNNPCYMYCGIMQRITNGNAGVLFEGGYWDKLITFKLEELEPVKGPPMVSPLYVVLEALVEKKDS